MRNLLNASFSKSQKWNDKLQKHSVFHRKYKNLLQWCHKKGLVLVMWVPGMIQPSRSVNVLMNWGCRGHWGYWGHWGCWGHWDCRGSKARNIITEVKRVIQVLEYGFILMFLKENIFFESWNIMLNFSIFSVRGCWGHPMSLFWKLIDETQISKPPEPAMDHNSIK